MTSRERVQKAVNFQVPDRVPVDLGGMKATGIAATAYARLKELLGLGGPTRVLDPRFMIAAVEEQVLRRFHADVLPVDLSGIASAVRPDRDWIPRAAFDGTPLLFPPGTAIREDADGSWILLDARRRGYRLPHAQGRLLLRRHLLQPRRPDRPGEVPARRATSPTKRCACWPITPRGLHRDTEYALLGWGFGVCFLGLSLITDRSSNVTQGRPDEWMMMLLTEKETCHQLMDRSVDAAISCLKLASQAVGDRCFAWGIASDDSGTQRGEFISPDLWAEMIKPHYARLCGWIHRHTKMKTFLHCCGSIPGLIPHLIEAGVDILNPVQTSAAGMDPAVLKSRFGGRIVFWGGGCDTQSVLPSASPEEIREHVRERMRIFQPGGGYVFNQVHNIQANVPAENIQAMLEAAHDFGSY